MMLNKPIRNGVACNAVTMRCRRSIRLKEYDYSRNGFYFLTICVQDRKCLLGEIINGKLIINPCGEMITKWVYKTEDKFNGIKILSFVVMPNHFHAIIGNTTVGATPCGRPFPRGRPVVDNGALFNNVATGENTMAGRDDLPICCDGGSCGETGDHVGSPLRVVVGWFKTMTTNEYFRGVKTLGWKPVNKRLWQRNYYEHIIRNQQSYNEIAEYIRCNPEKWLTDTLYMEE